ncbi:MAG: FxLYD domain-containing protein [Candidatus Poribacteria bacterium]|nr:FxLYD domain-containing protein [Candidatus Poribacteria bacterium]
MNQTNVILGAFIVVLIGIVIIGCSKKNTPPRSEDGEESGTELALNETYDRVRNGARLILTYDAQSNAFKGTVENTTSETLKQVRVEVHLSNGKELGPTPAADLAPAQKRDVQLIATSTDFDGWTAHPEVGAGEHSHGEEGGEHGGEGEGEHGHEEEGGEHD